MEAIVKDSFGVRTPVAREEPAAYTVVVFDATAGELPELGQPALIVRPDGWMRECLVVDVKVAEGRAAVHLQPGLVQDDVPAGTRLRWGREMWPVPMPAPGAVDETAGSGAPEPRIIDRGRGPELAGTRITVYNVLDYYGWGYSPRVIGAILGISAAEARCAIRYIEAHEAEVLADYWRILERHAKGNPPDVQRKLDASHERFMRMVETRRRAMEKESSRAGSDGGR